MTFPGQPPATRLTVPGEITVMSRSVRQRSTTQEMSFPMAYGWSVLLHGLVPVGLLILSVVLFVWLGLDWPGWLQRSKPHTPDLAFVLLPSQHPDTPPRNPDTRFRSTRNSRAEGRHVTGHPVNMIEKHQAASPKRPPSQTRIAELNTAAVPQASPHDTANSLTHEALSTTPNPVPSETARVDALAEPDFGPYLEDLKRRIHDSWHPPRANDSKQVVVWFQITRDGHLGPLKIKTSSGDPVADQAALATIQQIFPFRPLPAEFTEDNIDIEYTFQYTVFGDPPRVSQETAVAR